MKAIGLLGLVFFVLAGFLLLGGQNQAVAQEKLNTRCHVQDFDTTCGGGDVALGWKAYSFSPADSLHISSWTLMQCQNGKYIDSTDTAIYISKRGMKSSTNHWVARVLQTSDSAAFKIKVKTHSVKNGTTLKLAVYKADGTFDHYKFEVTIDSCQTYEYEAEQNLKEGWYTSLVSDPGAIEFREGTDENFCVQQVRVPGTPTLTEWGLIILVALLIGSTVFIMLRRRKAVPA
jgi:hypothetical protein